MTLSVKHKFVNPKSDTGDTTVARASNWNDEHDITMASGRVLGRASIGNGSAEELTPAQARALLEISPPGVLSGINTRTASYTLEISDRNKAIEMNVSTANTVTIPNESGLSGVNFSVGTQILVIQLGTGTTSLIAAAGVSLRSVAGGLSTSTRYGALLLYKRGSNDWLVIDQASAFLDGRVDTLDTRVGNIETVAGSMSNVAAVAGSIASVNTVAPYVGPISILSNAVANGDLLTDVYQGAGSVDPTTRLDGSALQNGDFYFNTSTNRTRTRANGVWYDAYPGGNTNADLVAYNPSGTGAVATTVQTKLRQTVSVFDFMTSAQIADVQAGTGSIDVSAAIQAAIDAVKPTGYGTFPEKGGVVEFPAGRYLVNSTVNVYSGVVLNGTGIGTVIVAGASLTNAVFYLTSEAGGLYFIWGGIQNLKIQTVANIFTAVSTTVWAIKSNPAFKVLQSEFRNLVLWVRYGIKFELSQDCILSGISSLAQADQILYLDGNFNRIEHLTKEGGGGEGPAGTGVATTEPYLHIIGTVSMDNILIEGAGSPAKAAIKFENANVILNDFWYELNTTAGEAVSNGFYMEIVNAVLASTGVFVLNGNVSTNKIKLRNGTLNIEQLNTTYSNVNFWSQYFDYDDASLVSVKTVTSTLALNVYEVSKSNNLAIQNYVTLDLKYPATPGRNPRSHPHYRSGQNLLINPSFEAGLYGWTINNTNPVTTTFPQSQVGQGLMLQAVHTGMSVEQTFVVDAAHVGNPITLNYVVKLTGAGWVVPISPGYAEGDENRVYAGTGWQTVTVTYRPQTAGTYVVGVVAQGTGATSSTLYLDEMSVCFGDDGVINTSKFGSFELNQRTFTAATAAPTTGTWKAGDRVFNSAPSVGAAKGWICTVAGTPGTWVSEGNL